MYKYLVILIVFCIFIGCQINPLYNIIPVTGGLYTHEERSIIKVEDENIRVFLNYDYQAGNHFSFFVFISNKSDQEIIIDPAEFYLEGYTNDNFEDEFPVIFYAVDPEYEIETLDNEIKKLDNNKKFSDSVDNSQLKRLIAVSKTGVETGELINLQKKMEQGEKDYLRTKSFLEEEKAYWEFETFRMATLRPGEKRAGTFYIPVDHKAKWFKIIIPVEENECVFNFIKIEEILNSDFPPSPFSYTVQADF